MEGCSAPRSKEKEGTTHGERGGTNHSPRHPYIKDMRKSSTLVFTHPCANPPTHARKNAPTKQPTET